MTSVKRNPHLGGIGFRAGGYFWRLRHLGKIPLIFRKREAGAGQTVSDWERCPRSSHACSTSLRKLTTSSPLATHVPWEEISTANCDSPRPRHWRRPQLSPGSLNSTCQSAWICIECCQLMEL